MYKVIRNTFICLAATSLLASCSLDEENRSSVTSDNYFKAAIEYDELVSHTYVTLRPLLRNGEPMWFGTDLYERSGQLNDSPVSNNDYTTMDGYEYGSWWADNYHLISKANQALTRGSKIANVTESLLNKREGELRALRAYAYFNLVESFSGVPLVLEEPSAPIYNLTRASEEEVYNQIIADLEFSLEAGRLPEKPELFGRVSQGFSNHLLAKVLLTRSYKPFAKSDDLTRVLGYANKAIALHPLLTGNNSWDILFGENNYVNNNSEVIFSVRYMNDEAYNSGGNNLYRHFKMPLDLYAGGARTAPYWRCDKTFQPTAFFYGLYDEHDTRGSQTYLQRTVWASANVADAPNGPIKKGDPILYFPREAMTEAEKEAYMATHKPVYCVINPDEYHELVYQSNNAYPVIWKFVDPNITTYEAGDGKGTRDTYVFRTAETILLLAEAYVKQGNGAEATKKLELLRQRAGALALGRDATIDDVMDESARELFGEANRWMDLKRCGKLLERARNYNEFTKRHHQDAAIPDYFTVRPIPLNEITNSNGTLTQNRPYPGSK